MLAVVLAAGRGKRLRPLTDDRSKAMLPIAGRPMLERVMEMLERAGVSEFIVVVHPDDCDLIALLTNDRWQNRVALAYQAQREGMAAALACAVPLIADAGVDEFVLASCDNIYPEGHAEALILHRRKAGLDAALTFLRVRPEQIPTLAVVAIKNGLVTQIVEKPQPEDAPSDLGVPSLYVLSTNALDYLPQVPLSSRGEREFPDVLRLMIQDGRRVSGVTIDERMTLTRPDDLLTLNRHMLRIDPAAAGVPGDLSIDTVVYSPVRIEAGVTLGKGCKIGPDVSIETGATVGDGCCVRNAVILRGASIADGQRIADCVIA